MIYYASINSYKNHQMNGTMKVLLIFPDIGSFHSLQYHPGLASISGMLKTHGYDVQFEYVSSKSDFDQVLDHVKKYRPEIIGFTSVETQFIYVKTLSNLIKEIHNCVIVCGGVYTTLFPEVIENTESLDAIIRGEGEYPFLELVRSVEKIQPFFHINNLAYVDKTTKKITINPLNPLITNLDELPFPDRSIFNFQQVIDKHQLVYFMFNRGCPYRCTYCCNHALARAYGMEVNKMRFRSVKSCMDEIRDVLSHYKFKGMLFFGDDLFIHNKKWLDEFLDAYKKEFSLPFMCEIRCNLVSPDLYKKLRNAGCTNVTMGIESGNDFIRNNVMKRGMSKEQIFNAFSWAHQEGIVTTSTCVIGLPFETSEMIDETADICAKTYVRFPGVNIFYPYKGTDLRKLCEDWGFLPEGIENIEIAERKESVLRYPHISQQKIQNHFLNWQKNVFRKRSLIYKIQFYPKLFLTLCKKGINLGIRTLIKSK